MTDLEYTTAKKQQLRVVMTEILNSEQQKSNKLIIIVQALFFFVLSGTTPLAASQSLSDVTGVVNRCFLEDKDNFSFFLGGLGFLSSHPSGEKLRSRYASSSSSSILSIFLYSSLLVIISQTPFAMQPFISSCFLLSHYGKI